MIRILERLSGRGLLLGAGIKTEVSYTLQIAQEMLATGTLENPSSTLPGLKTITGRVEFSDPSQEPGPSMEKLVLRLNDGRQDFLLGGWQSESYRPPALRRGVRKSGNAYQIISRCRRRFAAPQSSAARFRFPSTVASPKSRGLVASSRMAKRRPLVQGVSA